MNEDQGKGGHPWRRSPEGLLWGSTEHVPRLLGSAVWRGGMLWESPSVASSFPAGREERPPGRWGWCTDVTFGWLFRSASGGLPYMHNTAQARHS